MNLEIENLMNMALADGEVTEKERGIILRKAEVLGEDKDEVEMILDGKIALQKKELGYSQFSKENINNKEGDIKKCSSCGAPVYSFTIKCADCGHEFQNIESANSVMELVNKLDEAETKARNGKTGGWMSIMDGGDWIVEKRIFEAKSAIISVFPVPNSKEDILEFLALCVGQVNSIKVGALVKLAGTSGTYGYMITYKNAWLSLANKVILKARFSMKEDGKILREIETYTKELGIK